MLNYEALRTWQSPPVRHTYTVRDSMLYALGLGLGQDPLDRDALRFVYEKDLQVMPSMAAVLASPGFWVKDNPHLGVDWVRVVHGEQSVQLHKPLPASGTLIGHTRVTRVVDKGEGKGALLHSEKTLSDASSGEVIAVTRSVTFCRANGGFSAKGGGDPAGEVLTATPERAPDQVVEFPIRPEAALIYRLSGDFNPLHADPDIATQAGFRQPILHGLATYGMACHGIVKACCNYDASRLRSLQARFSSPTYPGETIRVECWREGERDIAFRVRVPARDVTVISHGRAQLA